MILNIYDLTHIITNIFGVFILYKFMGIFFDTSQANKKIEIVSYFIYGIIINLLSIIVKIPIVNLLSSIILFFLLTFNYQASIKNRVISTVYMYITLSFIENIVVVISGHFFTAPFTTNSRFSSILAMISIQIVSYIVVLLIGNYLNIKKGANIPNILWLAIVYIPLGILFVIIVLLKEYSLNTYGIAISIAILFTINIITFYLYGVLIKFDEDRMDKIVLKEQNKYYQKQLEIMDNNNKNARAFDHDLRNHLSIVRGYIEIHESKKACEYIDNMTQNDYTIKQTYYSGNIDIDTILNYKLYEANQKNISVSLEVKVPININISSFDIVVILGNLLDNAIEACSKVKGDDKKIDIKIKYKKYILNINIKNTFDGSIFYKKNNIITSKKDIKNHGIGLNNVKNILKKYNGIMEIQYNDSEFSVDINMYANNKFTSL